jgi:hypothetical protein
MARLLHLRALQQFSADLPVKIRYCCLSVVYKIIFSEFQSIIFYMCLKMSNMLKQLADMSRPEIG